MKLIPLGNGLYTKVDDKWFEAVVNWGPWYAIQKRPGGSYYARNGDNEYMQNLIMNAGPNKTIDHINLDSLDNQEHNLRPATNSQQVVNRGARSDSTSGVPGISWDKTAKCYRVYTDKDGKRICIKTTKSFEEALAWRNAAAFVVHGLFARIFDVNGNSSSLGETGGSSPLLDPDIVQRVKAKLRLSHPSPGDLDSLLPRNGSSPSDEIDKLLE